MTKDQLKDVGGTSDKNQYLVAFVVNLIVLGYGISCGWPSPSLLLLKSKESPLPTGSITMEEASWIAALFSIGGLAGNFLFGYITSNFGRKNPLLIITIPTVIGWGLILYAQDVYYLYAARFFNGFVGGAIFVIAPQYLAEISSDRIRGILGSTIVISCNTGMLLAFTFGNFFDYFVTPKFVVILTVVFALSMIFFPESPESLMKRNRVPETENSIRFYRSMRRDTRGYRMLELELNKLQSSIGGSAKKGGKSFEWSDLTSGAGKKAMIIGIVLALLNQFCGCFAMLNYTATIFEEAGSSMSPNMSAIVVGVIQLFGSYAATILVDRAGRKLLFAISTIGCALGLVTLGVYMMLKTWHYEVDALNWIPLVSFSFTIFIANWAILTLPFLVISEILPNNLKDFGTSVCMTILWSGQFIMLKFLPLLTDLLGFHGSLFLFAGVCLLSALFIILFMPETKGKSYDEIMKSLE